MKLRGPLGLGLACLAVWACSGASTASLPDGGVPDGSSQGDGSNPSNCPVQAPTGTMCSAAEEGLSCNYHCEFCSCSHGTWDCAAPGCASGCLPGLPPQDGTSCGGGCCGPQIGDVCSYTCANGGPSVTATCTPSGTWQVSGVCEGVDGGPVDAGGGDGGLCPVQQPQNGASCPGPVQGGCNYDGSNPNCSFLCNCVSTDGGWAWACQGMC